MTPATTFSGRTVALFGLGGSGLATAKALVAGGAIVAAWDDAQAKRDEAAAAGVPVVDLASADWSAYAALVLSPGVPLTHPAPHWTVERAKAAGIEIIGDIELFCRERRRSAPDAPFISITGTNGKSTTTALLAHILREAGIEVAMGGNIGTPILDLPPPSDERVHVVEVSSFQIDLTPSIDPTIGCLINITPDHLDRHGTLEDYAAIKERLVAGARTALVGVDDDPTNAIGKRLSQREGADVYPVSAQGERPWGFFALGREIRARNAGETLEEALVLADIEGVESLRGRHNAQNAAFACAAAWLAGVPPEAIRAGVRTFPGLAHRMEQAGTRGRVRFVNDSKATNAKSTEVALAAFERVHWILGGKPKAGGISALAPHFGKIAKAYLIGAATEAFAATLEGHVPFERCGTLDVAVARAAADAAATGEDEVVLFSPACASYDQFRNFEERGERFKALVAALP
ncbi:UDP-N-acetylmuramoyl-L-alanine--D-glutamate ligase [Salinarimonas ramus]|uniref:UDP-N-acetylmuramoylalanine--D-glutamate ligase n=1 Tax=Salinarimonas ramus TaxID=690164 RepID=A0A917Q8X1_9HYPH|nr:UDP-N-acetylmuramoyl-L-alanine--D-glutamate ligase [Salinarimonas ramus]GGK35734.1 UDP-N-acetylmuramoylalanine--D-glutamate ligase [Salinarimonas ramus]